MDVLSETPGRHASADEIQNHRDRVNAVYKYLTEMRVIYQMMPATAIQAWPFTPVSLHVRAIRSE